MKTYYTLILLAFCSFFQVPTAYAQSEQNQATFKEGTHYKKLDLEVSEYPTVTYLFSYYSPHAHSFMPLFRQLERQLPKGTKSEKVHASFMGGDMGLAMSKAHATMITLGIEDNMTTVMFQRIHILRKPPKNEEELRQIFIEEGIYANKFDAAYNGSEVNNIVKKHDKMFQDMGIQSVPEVVVNNKYLAIVQSVESTEQYFELMNYLLTLP